MVRKFAITLVFCLACAFGFAGCEGLAGNGEQGGVSGNASYALKSIDERGVTEFSYDQFQGFMNERIKLGMTLADVRALMGCEGTPMTGSAFNANTYAFYTEDKTQSLICVFDGSDGSSVLTSCEVTFD